MIKYIYFFFIIFGLGACSGNLKRSESNTSVKVEVREENGKFQIFRDGKAYYINGVAGKTNLKMASDYGANSIRTWDTYQIGKVLDEAHKYGMTVTVGLDIGKEYWGDDFDYWDTDAVEKKIIELKEIIIKNKDHPALLMWGVGNEVHLFGGNQFIVLRTIDKIAKMIQETDINHPVMTVMPHGPNFDKMGILHWICPNIDILGVNSFKKLPLLYDDFRGNLAWRSAYVVTEWSTPGPWDAQSTEWGAKEEPNSTQKAELVPYYWDYIKRDKTQCLGAYAFYWGEKFERTHTYVSLIIEDSLSTKYASELQKIWKGKFEGNHAPDIDSIRILNQPMYGNIYLQTDTKHQVTVYAHDNDHDDLNYRWEIRNESFSDFTPGYYNSDNKYLIDSISNNQLFFSVPENEGGYRIFCYVYDGKGHVGTVNLPFYALMTEEDLLP